mgnify:CR=1 FL=1
MAAKSAQTAEATEAPRDDSSDTPIDVDGQAVKKMLAKAKERGLITYDELHSVLPQDKVSSEQIEDMLSLLSEMGVNVV